MKTYCTGVFGQGCPRTRTKSHYCDLEDGHTGVHRCKCGKSASEEEMRWG